MPLVHETDVDTKTFCETVNPGSQLSVAVVPPVCTVHWPCTGCPLAVTAAGSPVQVTVGGCGGGGVDAVHLGGLAAFVAHAPLAHWMVEVPVYDGLHCSVAVAPSWTVHLPFGTAVGVP